ncbi:MAG TPA: hypothetical protein VF108_05575 [Actinomycetota bacterium]
MGRGALAKVRWKHDRLRKKKDRDKRQAAERGAERKAAKRKR